MGKSDDYIKVLKRLGEGSKISDELLGILDAEIAMPNIKFPTMGGKVFWTDIVVYGGWRLQQNDITHHARILDSEDVRIAWGTINGMYRAMDRLVQAVQRYDEKKVDSSEDIKYMEELITLKNLLDIGAITEEEFNEKKKRL